MTNVCRKFLRMMSRRKSERAEKVGGGIQDHPPVVNILQALLTPPEEDDGENGSKRWQKQWNIKSTLKRSKQVRGLMSREKQLKRISSFVNTQPSRSFQLLMSIYIKKSCKKLVLKLDLCAGRHRAWKCGPFGPHPRLFCARWDGNHDGSDHRPEFSSSSQACD